MEDIFGKNFSVKIKNISLFYFLLIIFSLSVLASKLFIVIKDYRYIDYGLDSSRLLINATSLTANSETVDYVPRVLFTYLSSIIKIITNVSNADSLLIPLLIFSFLSYFVCYLLAKEIIGNKLISFFAASFFVISIYPPTPHQILIYSFLFQPLIILILFKYLNNKASFLLLFLTSLAGFLTYSPIAFLTFSMISVLNLFFLTRSILAQDVKKIKLLTNCYLILPVILILTYFAYDSLVIPSYRGLYLFLKNSIGFWLSIGAQVLIYILVLSFLIANLLIWFLRFFYKNTLILRICTKLSSFSIRIFNCFKSINIHQGIFLFGFKLLLFILLIDVFFTTLFANYSFFLSYSVFSLFIHQELWRNMFVSYIPFLLIGTFGILLLFSSFEEEVKQKLYYLLIPIFGLFFSFLPSSFNLIQTYSSSRGFYSTHAFTYIIFSIVFFLLIVKIINNKKILATFVILLAFSSLSFSYTSSLKNFSFSTHIDYINGMKWLEKNKTSDNILYLNNAPLPSDPPVKFYGYAFNYSTMPYFGVMVEINRTRLDQKNFTEFAYMLIKHKVNYIVVEYDYPLDILNKISSFAKLVYSNNEIKIYKL